MSKRIYNTLRGSGEPTKARAIQTAAIRRRMEKLKKQGGFTSQQLLFMQQCAIAKMERELGLRPKEHERKAIINQLQQEGNKVDEQSVEPEICKTKIRTILWP